MRLLLTRPAGDSARTARVLEEKGAECLIWPLTRIVPVSGPVDVPPPTEAILFTSTNAVRAFAAASGRRDLPVLAVGDRTAASAREAGFSKVTNAQGDARDLARLAKASRWRRFLHPRGREAGSGLADTLSAAGLTVEAPVVYAAEPAGGPPPGVTRAFADGAMDLVTIWSPRNAAILCEWLSAAAPPLGGTDLLGISEAAVAPLRGAGFRRVAVAARPNAAGMLGWIFAALQP